jgi:hypothetical protein
MNQHTSKRDYYDPFSKEELERCAVPVQGTLTFGTPKGVSAPYPSEKVEPWDKVAVALAHALDKFGDAFSRWLVIQAEISTYEAIVRAEKLRASEGSAETPVSDYYWEYCVAQSVKDFCKKPRDP